MSRLRRPFLYDRFIFVTVNLLRCRTRLEESDFARLAGWRIRASPALRFDVHQARRSTVKTEESFK
jgi:hypothetical protein